MPPMGCPVSMIFSGSLTSCPWMQCPSKKCRLGRCRRCPARKEHWHCTLRPLRRSCRSDLRRRFQRRRSGCRRPRSRSSRSRTRTRCRRPHRQPPAGSPGRRRRSRCKERNKCVAVVIAVVLVRRSRKNRRWRGKHRQPLSMPAGSGWCHRSSVRCSTRCRHRRRDPLDPRRRKFPQRRRSQHSRSRLSTLRPARYRRRRCRWRTRWQRSWCQALIGRYMRLRRRRERLPS